MGIKFLNRFLRTECKNSIKIASLSELKDKKIAVDISIYMYKFEAEDTLIENMYLMLSIFRHYNITPVFVFDGKSPTEKKELLLKRRENKKAAKEEFLKLQEQLRVYGKNIDEEDKQEILNNMDLLKKQFVYITKERIDVVKDLIRAHGLTYYDAIGEADELCAQLVIKNKVWACLSEDMDMFVYGVPRILRYLSLMNHTIVIYDMKGILQELQISHKDLRQICVLSGTDYNINTDTKKDYTLYNILKIFKKYKKNASKQEDFYEWLIHNTNHISDYELLNKIYELFDLTNVRDNLKTFDSIRIVNGRLIREEIQKILSTDGFIFPMSVSM
jgi:5'-3' exonuclease